MLRTAAPRAMRPAPATPASHIPPVRTAARTTPRTATPTPAPPATTARTTATATTATASQINTAHAPPPATATPTKQEGDISNAFASLSGIRGAPLPDEFRRLKISLIKGHEPAVAASWTRLLAALRAENDIVAARGPAVVPQVRFAHLDEDLRATRDEIRKRGVVVVRGVVPEDEARAYKFELDEYIRRNPQTKGYPPDNPQVWELYWSAPQFRARLHPNLLRTQKALIRATWHATSQPAALISLGQPLAYADRLRIRHPGDAGFALGPHQDGGSVERWMRQGYGRAGTYAAVFAGEWDSPRYDPWDAAARVDAVTDLYNGLGACSAFRMFQGWLGMSAVGPREGTLLVNPLLKLAMAYALLRPFFRPRAGGVLVDLDDKAAGAGPGTEARARFLHPDNWELIPSDQMTSDIPGATPGYGMEFPKLALHPHLELDRTMVNVPHVRPGDYVAWHCDTIHAVDSEHRGTGDSSVLYIPICPATETNAKYVAKMREAWRNGTPSPDFPGGHGESQHVGRPDEQFVRSIADTNGLASIGLEPLAEPVDGSKGEKEVMRRINKILGFGDR